MVSKAKAKFIKSLQLKKYRKQAQSFLIEGAKSVQELLHSDYQVTMLLATSQFLADNETVIGQNGAEVMEVSEKELEALGTFKNNNSALAVGTIPESMPLTIDKDEYTLVLDDVRDPGNLGTVIRIADWYGIEKIVASETTADLYNPKVLNSSMGSFTRVKVVYTDILSFLKAQDMPVYGAYMTGENIHKVNFGKGGILVMGNESKGISPTLERVISTKVTIPRYGGAESLNVAIATAIICDCIRK